MSLSVRQLYLECYAGISGDMAVAALLDLGADEQVLRRALESLPLKGYEIKISRVKKAGVDACDFDVVLDKEYDNHDHDMEYLHGTSHEHGQGASSHDHHHEHHSQEDNHSHDHSHPSHVHRGIREVKEIIDKGNITPNARSLAHRIFDILAEAEAKAHGVSVAEVHFHEVGAVDSIVDVVATAVCLDNLGLEAVVVPVLYEGTGTVRCQHGILPIPVPAVANIISSYQLPMAFMQVQGEFVTPTGAAIVAAAATHFSLPEQFRILKIGVGAGKRKYERPSMVRAMLIETDTSGAKNKDIEDDKDIENSIYKLESNIDDCTGENLGYVMERLMESGAKDVQYLPVYMKKNRPAYQLNVICNREDIAKLEQIIFEETTTIGIRRIRVERSILKRRLETYETSLGELQVKVCEVSSGKERYYPEYDSLVRICRETGKPYQEVYRQVLAELAQKQASFDERG